MAATQDLARRVGIRPACSALGVARATYYRCVAPPSSPKPSQRRPPLKLTPEEQGEVLELLHSERFVDSSPRQVWATLLDDDQRYLCSVRTMYRLLESCGESRERRDQCRHPQYEKPELLATGPNEVWSWDITKLRGPGKGIWYYLYLILDVFSRCAVGWMVAPREEGRLAKELIRSTLEKQGVAEDQLSLHADLGPSMTSKTVALLLSELGVRQSHNRPYTSNDNPYSESQFKTMKYHPRYPKRVGSLQDARAFVGSFLRWYNTEHRHSSLALLTPADVHYGRAEALLKQRSATLKAAFGKHPARFKGRAPRPGNLPKAVWINPPKPEEEPFLPLVETPGPEQVLVAAEKDGLRTLPTASAGGLAAQLFDGAEQDIKSTIAH